MENIGTCCSKRSPSLRSVSKPQGKLVDPREKSHLTICLRVTRVCSKVLRIRIDMFLNYRILHGKRIKKDRSGDGGSSIAIETRLGWASCDWLDPCNDIVGMVIGENPKLRSWGVLEPQVPGGGGCFDRADGGCPDRATDCVVDTFLLETVETMARTFIGLAARSHTLWQGGVYALVSLLADCDHTRQLTIERAQRTFPRILALETALMATDCPKELEEFANRFLWFRTTPYRELLCLISEGHIDEAVLYTWRIHGSTHHEKGRLAKVDRVLIRGTLEP